MNEQIIKDCITDIILQLEKINNNLAESKPIVEEPKQYGRPKGTLKHHDEFGNPIGVYEYRRMINHKMKMEIMREKEKLVDMQIKLRSNAKI